MVTDRLFRRLRKLIQTEDTLAQAADKAGVDEKTARKYRDSDPLPSQRRVPHTWRTREDPFQDVWPDLVETLRLNPGLQAKTLFDDLQRRRATIAGPTGMRWRSSTAPIPASDLLTA